MCCFYNCLVEQVRMNSECQVTAVEFRRQEPSFTLQMITAPQNQE
jgi:hypothetical protein